MKNMNFKCKKKNNFLLYLVLLLSGNGAIIFIQNPIHNLTYMDVHKKDYGTLLCWGNNDIGTQSDPCIFNINPAGNFAYFCNFINKT